MALVTKDVIPDQKGNGMRLDYALTVGKFTLTMRRLEDRADVCFLGNEEKEYAERLSNFLLAKTVLAGSGEVNISDQIAQRHVFMAEKVTEGVKLTHRISGEPNWWSIVATSEQVAGLVLSIRNAFELR